MVVQHHAPHLVHLGFTGASDGRIVHGFANRDIAYGAAVFCQGLHHFAKSQHADQVAVLHDHQRADVFFRHDLYGQGQAFIGRDGDQAMTLNAKDVTDFHEVLLGSTKYSPQCWQRIVKAYP